jgi:1-acyl-sn-glycerol-3-phosphate acyltransferase
MVRKGLVLLFGLWFHLWVVLITLVMGFSAFCATFIDSSGNLSQALGRWWGRMILFMSGVEVSVEGLERLTPGQTYVYAANHRSNFDIYVLIAILPGRFVWVAKKSLFKIPVLGWAISRMGSIPVDRGNLKEAIRSLNHAAAVIKSGISTIIFPEGTRVPLLELQPFKKGVFIMALKAEQPIVPVSINGTFFIQPRGTLLVRPDRVKVVIAPPINPLGFSRKEELMAAVREAMATNYDPYFPYGPGGGN